MKDQVEKLEIYLRQSGLKGLSAPGNPVKVDRLEPLAHQGLSGFTFLLTLAIPQIRLILKVYRDRRKALKELHLLEFLGERGIPVPLVFGAEIKGRVFGKPFLLLEEIREESRHKRSKSFADALAGTLHALHSLNTEMIRIGLERRSSRDELKNTKILALMLPMLSLSSSMVGRALRVLRGLKSTLSRDGTFGLPALLHGDCGLDNVLYRGGTAYLIDWEEAFVGDPAYDVAYAYHSLRLSNPSDPELADYFVDSYIRLSGDLNGFELYKKVVALKLGLIMKLLVNPSPAVRFLLGAEKAQILYKGKKFIKEAMRYYLNYADSP
jgi:thiamine kinase-like enzyme